MKKTLALAAIASVFATSAFAGTFGPDLFGADIRNNAGEKVGYVTGIANNRAVTAVVNGQSIVLDRGAARIVGSDLVIGQ